jgi:hypothetical protein
MQLHLICSDGVRPALSYVLITRENMVATNSNVLGVIPTKELFKEDFIKALPEKGVLIHAEDFEKIIGYAVKILGLAGAIWENKKTIRLQSAKKRDLLIEVIPNDESSDIGIYPEWEKVVPDEMVCDVPLSDFSFNAELAALLQKALGSERLNVSFSGRNKAMRVITNEEGLSDRYGIIMPVKT